MFQRRLYETSFNFKLVQYFLSGKLKVDSVQMPKVVSDISRQVISSNELSFANI